MNTDQDFAETIDLGVASVETLGSDPLGFEPTIGHRQVMGLSDLD